AADEQRLAAHLDQLAERRAGTVAIVERMIGGEPGGAFAERGHRGPGIAAAHGTGGGAHELGPPAVVARRAGGQWVEGRDVVPVGTGCMHFFAALPVGVGENGALGAEYIAQRREQHVGAADDWTDRPQGGVDEDTVARLEPEGPKVSREAPLRRRQ